MFRKCFCDGGYSAGSTLTVSGKLSHIEVSSLMSRKSRKSSIILIFSSLAVADLLVAILVMPLGAVKEVRSRYLQYIQGGDI